MKLHEMYKKYYNVIRSYKINYGPIVGGIGVGRASPPERDGACSVGVSDFQKGNSSPVKDAAKITNNIRIIAIYKGNPFEPFGFIRRIH